MNNPKDVALGYLPALKNTPNSFCLFRVRLRQILTDFHNFFHYTLGRKYAIKLLLDIPRSHHVIKTCPKPSCLHHHHHHRITGQSPRGMGAKSGGQSSQQKLLQ